VPDADVDWSRHPSVAFLKSVDAAGNACPSMHVAFAVLSALWMQRLLSRMGAPRALQAVNGLWCLTILYSTLAIKQHVALDLYAGALLGAAIALPYLYFFPLLKESAAAGAESA
jgi:membrane-associated phospholipid phosphatase